MDSLKIKGKKPPVLDEQTLIPISFMAVLAGGIIWLTNIWTVSNANSQAISGLEQTVKARDNDINKKFDHILEDLNYIKGTLETRGSGANKGRTKRNLQD